MKIIVDAMGGDNAPESAVWGGALAAKEYGEQVLLVGDPDRVAGILKDKGMENTQGVTIMPASDLVDMHDDPATVLRRKPDSSMAVAFKLLKAGEGDALVSAGNTGALLTGATLYGGRIKGIRRGALAPVMPCKSGQVMLCDAGANTECTAEMLLQFAFLGSLYAEKINGIKNPRGGLAGGGDSLCAFFWGRLGRQGLRIIPPRGLPARGTPRRIRRQNRRPTFRCIPP